MATHGASYTELKEALLPPASPIPVLPPASLAPRLPRITPLISALQLHPTLEASLHILNHDLPAAHFLVRHMESVVPSRPVAAAEEASAWRQPRAQQPEDAEREMQRPPAPPKHLASAGGSRGRDVQAGHADAPKVEGMLLHALLHRIEGDYENARLWYRDTYKHSKQSPSRESVFFATWPDSSAAISEGESEEAFPEGPGAFLDRMIALKQKRTKFEGVPPERRGAEARDWHGEFEELAKISEREIRALLRWCEERYGTARWEEASSEWVGKGKTKEMANQMVVGGEGWRHF